MHYGAILGLLTWSPTQMPAYMIDKLAQDKIIPITSNDLDLLYDTKKVFIKNFKMVDVNKAAYIISI